MRSLPGIVLSFLLISPAVSWSQSAPLADRAQACLACHGVSGLGSDLAPALAGQDSHKLRSRLFSYKYRAGTQTLMAEEARRLSDREIEELALFFSNPAQKVSTP